MYLLSLSQLHSVAIDFVCWRLCLWAQTLLSAQDLIIPQSVLNNSVFSRWSCQRWITSLGPLPRVAGNWHFLHILVLFSCCSSLCLNMLSDIVVVTESTRSVEWWIITQSATGFTWSVNIRKVHHVQKTREWKSLVRECALSHQCDKVDLQVQSQTDSFFSLKKSHCLWENYILSVVFLLSKGGYFIACET